jgi:hypothetical protein
MPDFKVNPQPWMRDAQRVADDKLVADIVNDFRSYNPAPRSPLNQPPQTVVPVGAGKVVDGSDAPVASGGTGWADSPQIRDWRPPGLEHMDRMMDAQDAIDRAARARELIEASAIQRAEAEIKAQQMGLSHEDWSKLSEADLKARKEEKKLRDKGSK